MARSNYIAITLFSVFVFLLFYQVSQSDSGAPVPRMWTSSMAKDASTSITHTVLFQFKADASVEDVQTASARFLQLKEECIHPETERAYIRSLKGGRDISIEGLTDGITHGFVVEFASLEDRDYYVNSDPAHKAFVGMVKELVDKTIVVDFWNGSF